MNSLQPDGANSNVLVIILLGPTASGKTSLALDIAESLKLSVINGDSRQFYIGMDVGTAKPTKGQQSRIPHELIDISPPNKPINLKEFQTRANITINESLKKQGMAFLVGGSGLYLKAITHGLIPPAVPPQPVIRRQLSKIGQSICYKLLEKADPKAAKRIASNDAVRTQRALEVLYATGLPISAQQNASPPPWQILELGLDPNNLRELIIERTKLIYSKGLIEETQQLIKDYGEDLPLLKTIGYEEALKLIQGQMNHNEALERTIRRTQQFAKRQRTWFRRQHKPHWLKSQEPLSEALSLIRTRLV